VLRCLAVALTAGAVLAGCGGDGHSEEQANPSKRQAEADSVRGEEVFSRDAETNSSLVRGTKVCVTAKKRKVGTEKRSGKSVTIACR
jgi:hypothetical protein